MALPITVGFDRNEASYAAVRWAAAEAARRALDLRIVHCPHLPIVSDIVPGWNPPTVEGDEELNQLRSNLAVTHPDVRVTIDLRPGVPWVNLCDPSYPSELIVVGSSERRGAPAFWLGRTPRGVVRHARCPVIVARGDTTIAERVVVGIDGSNGAAKALQWAIEEANLHNAPMKVVHVWEYPYAPIGAPESPPRDAMQVEAARILGEAVQSARQECVAEVDRELLEGSPSVLLPDAVSAGDLLVLGSRGRGPLRSGLLGSTVNSVLDNIAVSVAIIPRDSAP